MDTKIIRCGKPIATEVAFREIIEDRQPSADDLSGLQEIFNKILAEADLTRVNVLCAAFGDSERELTGNDLYTSFFIYTQPEALRIDYSNLIREIKEMYENCTY